MIDQYTRDDNVVNYTNDNFKAFTWTLDLFHFYKYSLHISYEGLSMTHLHVFNHILVLLVI